MVTIPRPRIVRRSADLEAEDLPEQVTIAVRDLAGAVKEGLLALSVGVGLAVVHELFEAEVTRLAGPKGKHNPDRRAYRHGQESRQVTLGGRRVHVNKPRVRSVDDQELELRTFRTFASRDLLNAAALQRMLAGLSTRRYAAGLEPVGDVEQLATSKSAVSRRFVQGGTRAVLQHVGWTRSAWPEQREPVVKLTATHAPSASVRHGTSELNQVWAACGGGVPR